MHPASAWRTRCGRINAASADVSRNRGRPIAEAGDILEQIVSVDPVKIRRADRDLGIDEARSADLGDLVRRVVRWRDAGRVAVNAVLREVRLGIVRPIKRDCLARADA